MRDRVHVRLGLLQIAALLEHGEDPLSRLEAVEVVECQDCREVVALRKPCVEGFVVLEKKLALRAKNVDQRQCVALADVEIVEVVRRRDLHRARALFRVGILVRDDRDAASDERQDRVLADEILVALVLRVHGHGDIAEHRLGTRRRDGDEPIGLALDGVADVPEVALHLDLLNFEVRNRRLEPGVPVDEALVPVDEALLEEVDEDFQHRPRKAFVHREAFARPVARGAEALELVEDGSAGFFLPFPDALDELLAAEVATVHLSLHELPLDDHLRRDARVIRPGLPEHVLPAHALETAQDVLQRVVEGVAHVQGARHVRRRDDDRVRRRVLPIGPPGFECFGLLPADGNARLHGGRIESLVHRLGTGCWRAIRGARMPATKRSRLAKSTVTD